MSTFGQWFHNHKTSRLMWVCGSEPVLIDEVVDYVKTKVKSSAGVTGSNMRWMDHVFQDFMGSPSHLIVVRDAEQIQFWTVLDSVISVLKSNEGQHLLFVSDDVTVHREEKDEKGKKLFLPQIEIMRKSKIFSYVLCNGISTVPPTDRFGRPTRAADAVLWLQTHGPLSEGSGNHVLRRCGGDLAKARDVAQKVALFGQDVTKSTLDLLINESVTETFVESLLKGEKHRAVKAARAISVENLSQIIGQLDYLLDVMGRIHAHHRDFKSRRDVSFDDTIPTHLALLYWDVAKFYDSGKRRHCRQTLAAIDSCLMTSRGEGLLESLVALW